MIFFLWCDAISTGPGVMMMALKKKGKVNLDRCLINGVCVRVSFSCVNFVKCKLYFPKLFFHFCTAELMAGTLIAQLHLIGLNASNVRMLGECALRMRMSLLCGRFVIVIFV